MTHSIFKLPTVQMLDPEIVKEMKKHHYASTACFHEHHNECRKQCKFCYEICKCECHDKEEKCLLSLQP